MQKFFDLRKLLRLAFSASHKAKLLAWLVETADLAFAIAKRRVTTLTEVVTPRNVVIQLAYLVVDIPQAI